MGTIFRTSEVGSFSIFRPVLMVEVVACLMQVFKEVISSLEFMVDAMKVNSR